MIELLTTGQRESIIKDDIDIVEIDLIVVELMHLFVMMEMEGSVQDRVRLKIQDHQIIPEPNNKSQKKIEDHPGLKLINLPLTVHLLM